MSKLHINNSWLNIVISKGKWYVVSSLFTKGLSIIMLPIYTRFLGPKDFGVINVINSITQFLPIIISLYIDAAFGRFIHDYNDSRHDVMSLFSTVYWFSTIYGLLALFVSLFIIYKYHFINFEISFGYLAIASITTLLVQIGQLGFIYLRQSLETKKTTSIEVVTAIVSVVITYPLLAYMQIGVLAKLLAGLFCSLLIFCYYTYYFVSSGMLAFNFNMNVLKTNLKYSLPLLPNLVGGWISGMSDRLFLAEYSSLENVGIFSLASTLSTILYVIQDAVTQVTGPVIVSGLINQKEESLKKIQSISLSLWLIMLFFELGLILFSPEIILILTNKNFIDAANIIGICGFVYVVSTQYRIYMSILSYMKMTWVISTAGILMAFVSLILNYFYIPIYGIYAAAASSLISTICYTFWIIHWSSKKVNIKIPIFEIFSGLLFFLLLMLASSGFRDFNFINFIIKILFLTIFASISYLLYQRFITKIPRN
jgi:O-antigen/teichoic acid export membrane protein